eukprot:TRINITY_DN81440_c0_g1_i1.p1 TRINITY_DN81440_c0_g1~~TRINITY_DN81440_c0_g1_i1.p1  ORF type:complete len:227 (-),score=26.66 TRINITY_DN81440_c0_g1_i1:9-668(-)
MAKRKGGWTEHLSDDFGGLGLLLLLLGFLSLYFYLSSAARRRRRPVIQQAAGRTRTTAPLSGTSYLGWKILLNFQVVSNGGAISPSEVSILQHLASACDLYFVARVDSDAEAEFIKSACEQCDLFKSGLQPCKVLFCSTLKGKQAIARQLQPSIYVDSDIATVEYLAPHLPHIAVIHTCTSSTDETESRPDAVLHPHPIGANVLVAASVADFFRAVRKL